MSVRDDVLIKSTIKGIVVLNVPALNLKRTWQQKGALQRIPKELLEQAIYDPGVEYLFKSGILYIDDMQVKIDLGLEEEGEEPKIKYYDDKEMEKLLTATPLKEFREVVEAMSHDQAMELSSKAVDLGITDYQRDKILQDKTQVNVFNAVVAAQQEKEAEKEA